ncbi:MAG: lysophospholipid acyltransferase family protein [Spirosomataceae bacterium]
MKKIINYLLSAIFLLYFGIVLVLFHVVQVICFELFGKKAHQKSVNALNFFLVYGLYLTGTIPRFTQSTPLPTDRPLIFVANHQSTFDIPGIIWFLRKYTPLFVSKIELAKGIPSISYNLRVGGAALIDRKDGKRAIIEIARLGKYIKENNFSAAIFPEGTRTKTGQMKPFQVGGLATLVKRADNALIVPIAINGSWEFNPKGIFPLQAFSKISWVTLAPIEPKEHTAESLTAAAEEQIRAFLALS